MRIKWLAVITMLFFCLLPGGIGFAAGEKPEGEFAVYSQGSISLSGTSVVKGHAASGSGLIDLTATDGSNRLEGNIYVGSPAQITSFTDNQYGEVIEVPWLVFPDNIPAIPAPPTITNYVGGETVVSWWPKFSVAADTHYETLIVDGPLFVDVQSGDRVIRAGSLTLSGGKIYLQGNHKLYLFVDGAFNYNSWTTINPQNTTEGCPGISANLHIFLANGDLHVAEKELPMNGNIYLKNGSVNLQSGGSQIKGNVVVGGHSAVIGDGAHIKGVVYAPRADVQMSGGSKITGRLVAKSLSASGGVVIDYCPCELEIPDIPHPPQPFIQGLLGEYYDTLEPVKDSYKRMVRIDEDIAFSWQDGSPDLSIDGETFSVRWTGSIEVPEDGAYSFYTLSDDGVQLWIDGRSVINRWEDISLEFTESSPLQLQAGKKYPFKLEYQENRYNATIFLFWQSEATGFEMVPQSAFWTEQPAFLGYVNQVKAGGSGLKAEYFIGSEGVRDGSASVLTRSEGVNHRWGGGSPDPAIPEDYFSARWSGYIEGKYSEAYYLGVAIDDGIRIWIEDELRLEEWGPNSDIFYAIPDVAMENGGFLPIKIEFMELTGSATCILYWSSEGQEREVVPVKYLYATMP